MPNLRLCQSFWLSGVYPRWTTTDTSYSQADVETRSYFVTMRCRNTRVNIVESLTTEVGPRLAGSGLSSSEGLGRKPHALRV